MPSPGQISIFGGGGGEYSWVIKTQNAKSWLNLDFQGGGEEEGVFLGSQNSKCQVLTNFSFWEGILGKMVKKFWKPSLLLHRR